MPDSPKESYIEFEPPNGWEPPEGVEVNQDFDVVASFRIKPNGEMCLLRVGGLPIGGPISQAPEKSTGEGMVSAFKNQPKGIPWDTEGVLGI